jgi:hypothetical protein
MGGENSGKLEDWISDVTTARKLGRKAGEGTLSPDEKEEAVDSSKIAPEVFYDQAGKTHWSESGSEYDPNTEADK